MIHPQPAELADFIQRLRAGNPPVQSLGPGRSCAAYTTTTCTAAHAAQLATLANKPPPGLILCKFGSRSIVGSFHLPEHGVAVLKYYYPSNLVKHFTYGLRGSRCRQSWIAGLALDFLGIPTPAPLLIAEWSAPGGFWLRKSFLATRQADGVALDTFISTHGYDHPLVAQAVASLRQSLTIMARHRSVHGDLKANNLLVSSTGVVSLIDLDAAAFLLPESQWQARRDKDRRRFLANWHNDPDATRLFQDLF